MKAQLLKRTVIQNSSFILEDHTYNNFLKVWQYHPDLELVIIREGTRTRFVGDSIEKFGPGEIVLIGKNLPHLRLNDKINFNKQSGLRAKAHVVHFYKDFARCLLKIPEMNCISHLFNRANRGIKSEGSTNVKIIEKVEKMFNLHEYEKLIALLDAVKWLADQKITAYFRALDMQIRSRKRKTVKLYGFTNTL